MQAGRQPAERPHIHPLRLQARDRHPRRRLRGQVVSLIDPGRQDRTRRLTRLVAWVPSSLHRPAREHVPRGNLRLRPDVRRTILSLRLTFVGGCFGAAPTPGGCFRVRALLQRVCVNERIVALGGNTHPCLGEKFANLEQLRRGEQGVNAGRERSPAPLDPVGPYPAAPVLTGPGENAVVRR